MSAGGGFTRTGIATIVDMDSLEIEVDVNEAYINRVQRRAEGRGDARRLSGLEDPGARHQHRADRRPPEGDGEGAHRLRPARPAHPARTWASRSRFLRGRAARPRRRARASGARARRVVQRRRRDRRLGRARRQGRAARGQGAARASGDRSTVIAGLHGRRARRGRCARRACATARRCELTGSAERRGATDATPIVRIRDVVQGLPPRRRDECDVLDGLDLDIAAGRVPRADGAVGLGQVDAAEPDRRARPADLGHASRSAACASTQLSDARSSARWRARPRRLRVPDLQPAAGAHRRAQRRAAAAADPALARASAREARRARRSKLVGLADRAKHYPRAALGRPGAARRHRARDRHRPDAAALRRADRRPRPQVGRRDPRPARRRSTASTARPSSWSRTIRTPPSARTADAAPRQGHAARRRAA